MSIRRLQNCFHQNFITEVHNFYSGCTRGRLNVRDVESGDLIKSEVVSQGIEIVALSMSPDGKYLAFSMTDKLIRICPYPSLIVTLEISFYAFVKASNWNMFLIKIKTY